MGQWNHVQHVEEKLHLGGRRSEGMVRSGDKGESESETSVK